MVSVLYGLQNNNVPHGGITMAKLAVFGASGRIGAEVVRQALDAGHTVTAVVRGTAHLPSQLDPTRPGLTVVTVPGLSDPGPLGPAVAGADAVISGVGPRRRSDVAVASTATRAILTAMREHGVRRLVVVSAVPVGPAPDGESLPYRLILLPLIKALLKGTYADLGQMEDDLRDSGTDWTVVRPPRLTDRPLTGKYRTVVGGNVARGPLIGRADVAHAMLAALDDPATIGQPVGAAY